DLGEGAGHRRRDVGVHLVGADLQQRLSLGDLVTDRLVPDVDGALVHRLTHPWHDHLCAHQFLHVQPPSSHTFVKASARSGSGPAFASSVARSTAAFASASIWSRTSSSTPREMSTPR